MIELLKDEDLANRKFFHKPVNHETGDVRPHASFVKEFIDDIDEASSKALPVRLAHQGG